MARTRESEPGAGRETFHIGEVAGRVGLSLRTVRYYEEVGLVRPSGRTDGGFRLYTDEDVERLSLAKMMKPLDFSLDEMRDLLELRERIASGEGDPTLIDRLSMYATLAAERCERLRLRLDQAERFSRTLSAEVRGRPGSRRRR
jgi:DNA-binding transcriptional MerR regulator